MIAQSGPLAADEDLVPAARRRAAAPAVTAKPCDAGGVPCPVEGTVWERRRFWLRVLFALDVIGAGGPGVLMLAAPEAANRLLFAGGLTPDAGTRVLGCVWVSLGVLAVAGLFRPVTFGPVLLVQFGYKLIWLGVVGIPALVAGGAVPWVLAGIFAGWVAAVGVAAPWGALFGREAREGLDFGRVPR
jgi:hypothetical protein